MSNLELNLLIGQAVNSYLYKMTSIMFNSYLSDSIKWNKVCAIKFTRLVCIITMQTVSIYYETRIIFLQTGNHVLSTTSVNKKT